ncbi:hypothetical protein [Mycobacterium leprae]|uniref:hypothetical protein n=1 Tax=Mycobacterium leprae TaxID=1769 RepID=UPI0002F0347D|nr:hypothetical protein A8144_00595 [Mycobacterium leprae 3125609]OAX72278.1 hypothetical protein A3216_00660 [Mycobacterium leprae 7935681]
MTLFAGTGTRKSFAPAHPARRPPWLSRYGVTHPQHQTRPRPTLATPETDITLGEHLAGRILTRRDIEATHC